MRTVEVQCDECSVYMTLDLKSEKADGGFHSCDIEHELKESGWTLKRGRELCDECSAVSERAE